MKADSPADLEARSIDAFLGGRVTLVQPRKGHRAGLDAALLQALVPSTAAGLAVDLGAGVGTVAFCLAARARELAVVGVERDPELVACGSEALTLSQNGEFGGRVRLVECDANDQAAMRNRLGIERASVDFVVMNPPFEQEGRGSQSPHSRRRDAHVASEGLLQSWCATAAALLRPGGMIGLIHRADALADVLDALAGRFGAIQVLPAHPMQSGPAIRVLVTARRGSGARLAIRPGLILHEADGAWTPRADAILRGQAELAG